MSSPSTRGCPMHAGWWRYEQSSRILPGSSIPLAPTSRPHLPTVGRKCMFRTLFGAAPYGDFVGDVFLTCRRNRRPGWIWVQFRAMHAVFVWETAAFCCCRSAVRSVHARCADCRALVLHRTAARGNPFYAVRLERMLKNKVGREVLNKGGVGWLYACT